jgi:hypothetical protein
LPAFNKLLKEAGDLFSLQAAFSGSLLMSEEPVTPSRPVATINPTIRLSSAILGGLLALAGCGGPDSPSGSTTTTSALASTTTSSISSASSAHYSGTVTPPSGSATPIDLSIFFNLPGAASLPRAIGPLAIYNVTGGFNTNPNGYQGTVEGTLDGTPADGGTFTGTLSTRMSNGCLAKRNYVGPLSTGRVNWTAGSHIDSCGGQSPLTWNALLNSDSSPPTTSVATTSVATTSVATTSAATTSVATTTVATTTSVRTTTSSSTSTTTPQSNLVISFRQNPVSPVAGTTCTPSTSGRKVWNYTLSIQNPSSVPFTISSWTSNLSSGIAQPTSYTAANFGQFFPAAQGGTTIGANSSIASTTLCADTANFSIGGTLTHTFTGANSNGPYTTPVLTLSP